MALRILALYSLVLCLWVTPVAAQSRLISLKPNITEIIYQLGAGKDLVGVTRYCDFPEAAKKLPRVADYIKADPEKILVLKPDLILASQENGSQKEVIFLMNRGIAVELFSFTTLKETLASIHKLGRVLGKEAEAKTLVEAMQRELEQLADKNRGGPKKNALFVVGYDPLVVVGGDNFINDVMPYLGLTNVAAASKIKYPTWSTEQLIRSAPEMIVELPMGSENTTEKIKSRNKWWQRFPSIPAVRHHKIISFPVEEIRAVPQLPQALFRLVDKMNQTDTSTRP